MALYLALKNKKGKMSIYLESFKVLFHLLKLDFQYDLHLPFNLLCIVIFTSESIGSSGNYRM